MPPSKVLLMDRNRSGLIQPGQILQFNGRDAQALVTRRGTVLFQGVECNTLSEAARTVTNWPGKWLANVAHYDRG